MLKLSGPRFVAAVLSVALVATACGTTKDDASGKQLTNFRLMIPTAAGGGYDVTGRTAAKVMEETKIARRIEVFNLVGAGGTVGLTRLVNEKGNGDLAMLMGLGVVGSVYTNKSKATLHDTTPLAKLIEEPDIIVVPKDSPYKTLGELIAAWKARPGKVTVGGASSPGGPDHLLPMQLAQAVGIDPKQVNYVSYDSGGDLLPAVLGSKLSFAASGVGEYLDQIKAGAVRVLAVTSAERLDVLDAPTLKEQGVDLVFTNWRGIVAPPGIDAKSKAALIDALDRMHSSPEWKDALKRNGWTDAYVTGDEYGTFLTEQDQRVESVLDKLGLA
jgi:putative tricarboxylic transport membrane protein